VATVTEKRLEAISQRLGVLESTTALTFDGFRREIENHALEAKETNALVQEALQRLAALEQRVAHLERTAQETSPSRVSVVEEKCRQLEKHHSDSDQRRWQLVVAVLTCFFTGLIALIVALLKK
jgi:hypothetical protein